MSSHRPASQFIAHSLRALVRSRLLALVLIAAEALLRPALEDAAYAVRLGALPAPTTLPVPVEGVRPAGMRVAPGAMLGYVGNTGNARTTPSHLHYGIYTADGAIDHHPLLRPRRLARKE